MMTDRKDRLERLQSVRSVPNSIPAVRDAIRASGEPRRARPSRKQFVARKDTQLTGSGINVSYLRWMCLGVVLAAPDAAQYKTYAPCALVVAFRAVALQCVGDVIGRICMWIVRMISLCRPRA